MSPSRKKSKGLRKIQEPTSSTNLGTKLSENYSFNSITDPSHHSTMDLSQKSSPDPSLNLPTDLSTEPSMNPSAKSSKDLPKNPSKDPMNSSKSVIKSPCVGFFSKLTTTPSMELSTDPSTMPPVRISKNPFLVPSMEGMVNEDDVIYTLSMNGYLMPRRPYEIEKFNFGNLDLVEYNSSDYPSTESMYFRVKDYIAEVDLFGTVFCENKIVDATEVDRIQQIFDEFGQTDPEFPPSLIVEFLQNGYHIQAFKRIIHWAISTNITPGGDIQHTLLPARIIALFRDIDSQSSVEHQILSRKWIQLTFGLMKGGFAKFAASDEWHHNMHRIKCFFVRLFKPHCRKISDPMFLSQGVDRILKHAVAVGFLLFGHNSLFRWDWKWLQEEGDFKKLSSEVKALSPQSDGEQDSDLVPFVQQPALLLESDQRGATLTDPITFIKAEFEYMLDAKTGLLSQPLDTNIKKLPTPHREEDCPGSPG